VEPTSIKGAFQGLNKSDTALTRAKVISVSPLRVQGIEDAKFRAGPAALIIPRELTDYTVNVEGLPESEDAENEITIKNALKIGDTVYLLACNKDTRYFILGRV